MCNHAGETMECASGLYLHSLVVHVMLSDANSDYSPTHAVREGFLDGMHGIMLPVCVLVMVTNIWHKLWFCECRQDGYSRPWCMLSLAALRANQQFKVSAKSMVQMYLLRSALQWSVTVVMLAVIVCVVTCVDDFAPCTDACL